MRLRQIYTYSIDLVEYYMKKFSNSLNTIIKPSENEAI